MIFECPVGEEARVGAQALFAGVPGPKAGMDRLQVTGYKRERTRMGMPLAEKRERAKASAVSEGVSPPASKEREIVTVPHCRSLRAPCTAG